MPHCFGALSRPTFCSLLLTILIFASSCSSSASRKLEQTSFRDRRVRRLQQEAAGAAAQDQEPKTLLDRVLSRYFSNDELEAHLRDFARRCAAISKLHSIGKSANGTDLTVLVLGSDIAAPQPRPAFRYVANMHGDEPSGRQLLLALAEWLCARHSSDAKAAAILDGMQLHLMPTLNPDGFARRRRENTGSQDLNRDFPDPVGRRQGPLPAKGTEQPETLTFMHWARSRSFVAAASLHEGALVANYPWDGNDPDKNGEAKSPDDATFRFLASTYAQHHVGMADSEEFQGGITNGAAWYPVYGGMQDWSYVETHCMELTLEMSESKWPPPETLPDIFTAALPALLQLPLTAAFAGVRGFVFAHGEREASERSPIAATIAVDGIASHVHSDHKYGDFYRPLAPGQYTLEVSSPRYTTARQAVTVPKDGSGMQLNFTLAPVSEQAGSKAVQGGSAETAAVKAAAEAKAKVAAEEGAAADSAKLLAAAAAGAGLSDAVDQASTTDRAWLIGRSNAAGGIVARTGGLSTSNKTLWVLTAVLFAVLVLWVVNRRQRRIRRPLRE